MIVDGDGKVAFELIQECRHKNDFIIPTLFNVEHQANCSDARDGGKFSVLRQTQIKMLKCK